MSCIIWPNASHKLAGDPLTPFGDESDNYPGLLEGTERGDEMLG